LQPDNLGNPNLQPETSMEWELGFEAGLFMDRDAFDRTHWNRTVQDLLVARRFQPSGGFLSQQLDNLGAMDSWGVEMRVSGTAINRPGFSLDIFAKAALLWETVTDPGGAPDIKVGCWMPPAPTTWRRRTWSSPRPRPPW